MKYDAPCVKWRQTSHCRSDGPRKSVDDQYCDIHIKDEWSGYCECADGQVAMAKGCTPGNYKTCDEACLDVEGKYMFINPFVRDLTLKECISIKSYYLIFLFSLLIVNIQERKVKCLSPEASKYMTIQSVYSTAETTMLAVHEISVNSKGKIAGIEIKHVS